MSFVEELARVQSSPLWEEVRSDTCAADAASIPGLLGKPGRLSLDDFATLISSKAEPFLEAMGQASRSVTRQRFGRVMRLFAPLYVSNECINNCSYCGFSRDNPILRVTLSLDEVEREGHALASQGFRNILVVAGEHPKFVSNGYLADCVKRLREIVPSISLEVGPMDSPDYAQLTEAGAEGLVVYQETYDRTAYGLMHTAGPKRDFDYRLKTPERAYHAGFRRLGIGALFGLSDWRGEALALAAHAQYLLRHCWKSQLTLSLPRLRPCAGSFKPTSPFTDRHLAQLICALRLYLPDVGLVLSTREPAHLRNGLLPLGITLISAGSHTEPGGYTGAGKDRIHYTQRGRVMELQADERTRIPDQPGTTPATGQFDISDDRSPAEMASQLRSLGYDPVWKDWDSALTL